MPTVGVAAEIVGYAARPRALVVASGGLRRRFGGEGLSGYVQLLLGAALTENGGDTLILKPGVGLSLPLNSAWAVRVRADWHVEGEGAGAVFGAGLAYRWGAR